MELYFKKLIDYDINKIQSIKDKSLFGNFIEVGSGIPIYNELCNHPDTASKIVNLAFSPNNWDFNKKYYQHNDYRAVSPEVAYNLTKNQFNTENKINFVLTNTIQIANTPDVQTHGWFCLYNINQNIVKLYHFTINGFRKRKEYIEIIKSIGLDILASYNNINEIDNGYIDIVLDLDKSENDIKFNFNKLDTLKVISNGFLNKCHSHNTSTVFKSNNSIERFNNLLREVKTDLIIFKGSFNPIHPQHLQLIKELSIKLPTAKIVFCISTHNRNKSKIVTPESLNKRINLINKLGFDVIIDFFGEYHYSYTNIINNVDFKDFKLHYIMGSDIMQYFLNDLGILNANGTVNNEHINDFNSKWNKCCFWWTPRPGFSEIILPINLENIKQLNTYKKDISSTNIRTMIDNNDLTNLKILVGPELTELYLQFYNNNDNK